jgi:large subunit ribosomal protein L21
MGSCAFNPARIGSTHNKSWTIASIESATCTAIKLYNPMTYAIIETGGKQIRVEPGRFYDIELLHVEPEDDYTIDKVLLLNNETDVTVGQPYVQGATVEGTIVKHYRAKKVLVYKMKPKKKTRKKRGHRQEITRLMINSITVDGKVIASAPTEDKAIDSVATEVEA